jgi:phosphoribosylformylglycinamidine synthase subunit PurL
MPRRPRSSELEWAPEALTVPVRDASSKELRRLSTHGRLGFDPGEWARIRQYYRALGRDPTDVELAGLAQSWSEHCSYKSSRPHLRRAFGSLHPSPKVLGTGDAGVLRFEDGFAYAIRIESHNHPSAIEPYGGAATGIGGILRDILAVGAKPIALADPLFFGPLDPRPGSVPEGVKSPRYIMSGVVAGIRDYGNRVGVPTVSGGVYFDPAYVVNPLVNVGCVGFLPRARLRPNRAQRAGDRLVLVGGHTGRDGIGGVAFASRELSDRSEAESRGAVQLGNPILKEPLIRACLEAFDRGLVAALKDLGGGGLATASGELVYAGGFGSRIDLDRVPVREPGLAPWEIWVSESQERMVLDVEPPHLVELLNIFRRYDVPATDVGEVTKGPLEQICWKGRSVASLDLGFRVDPPPARRKVRPRRRTRGKSATVGDERVDALVERMVLAPDSVSRESIVRVYDHEVQGRTVVKSLHGRVTSPSHGDAAVLQPRPESWQGLAIATAAQPWACREDPVHGSVWVVEEAARNLYSVGARPDAFTNCLNFGNPEDPKVMGDFVAVVQGLAQGAHALGFAVPSGNVSLYNGGLGAAVPPTPVLMATGIVPDLRRAITSDFKEEENPIYLVGRTTRALGGSLWARLAGASGLALPPVDPKGLRRRGEKLLTAGESGMIRAVHDVSDGGLAVALCEMAFGGELGFTVDLAGTRLPTPQEALVVEGNSRFIVEVAQGEEPRFSRLFRGEPHLQLGLVTRRRAGVMNWNRTSVADLELCSLYERWRAGVGIP